MQKNYKELKVAYIGGGSRGWAWGFMTDLAQDKDMGGTIYLYDIDYDAAKKNETIGNSIEIGDWSYRACNTIGEALEGADFVIISIFPGTFDEMHSDVHYPEKYGIYQSVGDSVGPGGIIRSLRTVPMFEEFGEAIKKYCPDAWVINYTNPMSISIRALYRTFPQIKAFGCCHEVFGTQVLLTRMLDKLCGIQDVKREEIKVNPIGVNHFTWVTEAKYKNVDLYPYYREFVEKYYESGFKFKQGENLINDKVKHGERVKFDLFLRYGVIAAAGDRHLAEFCPGDWYLNSPEQVENWGFSLTTVDWRRNQLRERLEKSAKLLSGELKPEFKPTGEDGCRQMRALLGLDDLVTNVNLPNRGQIPNLPMGAIVETNAIFRGDSVKPVFAGEVPESIYSLVSRACGNQVSLDKAIAERSLDRAFAVFANDPLVRLPIDKAREMFDGMIENTKDYLGMYK